MTANGGAEPKAWNMAHSTQMSKPHHATAPSSPGSRERIMLTAVRTPLDEGDGLPIGIADDGQYQTTTVPLENGGSVLVVSDGIIEQFGLVGPEARKLPFDMTGVRQSLQSSQLDADAVADLSAAVAAHAGTEKLSDDATAVLVKW